MRNFKLVLAVALVVSLSALMFSCSKEDTSPTSAPTVDETPVLSKAAGSTSLSGAIFTTTPDGGIVNENTHYESELEVYLDGGPAPNAPQHAAGLPDGYYVFQITDPPGKVLLSEDPAKCRVVRIEEDIIVELVEPMDIPPEYGGPFPNDYTVGNGGNAVTYPCHIPDDPDGAAGVSGRHDTNTDVDYGVNGAIVVQMMPFLDTPNPGGVYKAWMTPIEDYLALDGDLTAVPERMVKFRGQVLGFENDPGFGPPRNRVKTDNFKVVERPPMVHVFKYEDLNGNGVKDPGEPEITGWKITITETLHDATTVSNDCYTPCWRSIDPGATVTVSEELPGDWAVSYVLLDGEPVDTSPSVSVTFGPGQMDREVIFGNFQPVDVMVHKFQDCDANGVQDTGEPYLEGWEFCLYDASGNLVSDDDFVGTPQQACQTTDDTGQAGWTSLVPGEYTVMETPMPDWYSSTPDSKSFDLGSGESGSGVFGNYQLVQVTAHKFHDLDADGVQDLDEPEVEGFEFCLRDAAGNLVDADDFMGTPDPACQTTGADGLVVWDNLIPSRYEVVETPKPSWEPTTPTEQTADFTTCVDGNAITVDFGNILLVCRVTGGQVDESGTCTACPEGSDGLNRFTCGGQAGAPTALESPPWGEWTHSNKSGLAGRFTFHAGMASAPSATEISWIGCSDPGYCDPARPAPAKQIDFGGVGTFKNLAGTVPSSIRDYVDVGTSLHYFEVNVDDLGEPGRSGWTDPDPAMCPVDGFGLNSATEDAVCACPDFYRIRIYATESPSSMLLYEAQGYIAGGNFQIHPLTGYDRN